MSTAAGREGAARLALRNALFRFWSRRCGGLIMLAAP